MAVDARATEAVVDNPGGDGVAVTVTFGAGPRSYQQQKVARGGRQVFALPQPATPPSAATSWTRAANEVSSEVSLGLLRASADTAKRTQRRLSQTYTLYLVMLVALFAVGLGGFVAALVSGFMHEGRSGSDPVTTVTFAGLSAVSFVTFFLSRPSAAMARLGPHTAWVLSIVNTYWTKLAYFNDPRRIVPDLNEAQQALDDALVRYLKHADRRTDQLNEGSPSSTPPTAAGHRDTAAAGATPSAVNGPHDPPAARLDRSEASS